MFRYMVLGLLRNGEKLHGYALMKEYRTRSGLQMSTGNFYRELQRLGAEGLVREVINPEGADPRRAPYEITEAGAAAFDAWLTGPNATALGQYDDELSTRALFVSSNRSRRWAASRATTREPPIAHRSTSDTSRRGEAGRASSIRSVK